jgi:spore maturation protein CgeB
LTSENDYMKEYFKDGENILFYNGTKLDKLNDKVVKILKDDTKRSEMAHKGREIVMHHHTWDQRMAILIKELDPIIKNFNTATGK